MIESGRCKMHILKKSDHDKIKELFINEKVRKFLGGIVNTENFDRSFHNMITCSNDYFYWIVRLKHTNEVIGLVSLDKHHDGFNTELSYQFMPKYWGYGYAEEVIRKIIDYAFYELDLNKIVAETQSANTASCNLLKRVGMHLEQILSRFGAEQYIFGINKPI